jgi:hypothetical protein
VAGGDPVLLDTDNPDHVRYARVVVGKGVVGVFADSLSFSNQVMGPRFAPFELTEQKDAFQLQALLLSDLLDHRAPSPAALGPRALSSGARAAVDLPRTGTARNTAATINQP